MTTGTPPEPASDALHRWAAEQLEFPPDVSPKESRAAFMLRLRDEDFMPPLCWQQASRALLGGKPSETLAAEVRTQEEARLRAAVETFAVEFFLLDVAAREQRWKELCRQCAFSPPLMARLRGLERGLRLAGQSDLPNPSHRELAGYVRELFVLRPHARATRRQELYQQFSPEDIGRLSPAAQGIFSSYPELGALDPDFLRHLATWNVRAAKRRENRERRRTPVAAGNSSSSDGNWKAPVWVIVACITVFLRFIGSMSSSSNPPYKYVPPPTFSMPELERIKQADPDEMIKMLDDLRKRNRDRELKATQRDTRP